MGFFSRIKKTVKGIAKNPTNLRNYGDLAAQTVTAGQVDTHGFNNPLTGKSGGSIDDLLLGKKSKDINPDDIANQIRATQSKGLGELNAALDAGGGGDIARQQNALQQQSVLTSAQDARRNAQATMARQGLKGTSLGLATNRTIDQSTGQQIAGINAALPGQIRDQQLQDAQTRIGAGNINQNGMNFNTIQGSRSGGLLGYASQLAPLAGGIGQVMGGVGALKAASSMNNSRNMYGVDRAGGSTGYSQDYLNG